MAQTPTPGGTPPPATTEVTVAVPQATDVQITDLSGKSDAEIDQLLKQRASARIKFIILNAPFKVRPLGSE